MARRAGCAFALFVIVITGSIASFVALVLGGLGVIQPLRAERVLSITGLVLAGIAVSVSIVVVRRVAAPTRELIEAAHRIESGDHSTRINERGPAPVRSVARALNAMSARIEAEEVRRRSVLADVAHELRTSLTIVRGQAEAISDGVYPADAEHVAPILAATHALEALTDDLRTLALAEAGALQLAHDEIDPAVLVNETLDAYRPAAMAAGVLLESTVAANTRDIQGDAARLRSVLGNLVGNALAHTPRGGTVRVTAAGAGDGIDLTVADDGAGIDPELLPRIFDRFVKGAHSSGSGLGLAIVRDIVEAHGGSVSARSMPGTSTEFRVHLPQKLPA